MKKILIFPLIISLLPIFGCSQNANNAKEKEEVISLFLDNSRLYFETLEEKDSYPLKTYHHKKYGEIPYVRIDEYIDTFPKTSIGGTREYKIVDGKFVVGSEDFGTFTFDAEKDIVTSSKDVLYFFKDSGVINNIIPTDSYVATNFERFTKGNKTTKFISRGKERVYDCGKYSFDIVYEKGEYYAPFSLLNSLFFEHKNETSIFNGKNYFDTDGLTGENPTVQYCYSSKGNFLLDLSGGKLGTALFENKTPVENEEYHFETIIQASGQKIIFSLANGTGFIKSYDSEGKLIEEDVFKKVIYERKDDLLILKYFSVLDEKDDIDAAISDVYTLTINMDETFFAKGTRSQIVADFTYQELRFTMYELYGKTRNTEVRDFDNFIKDKDYKDDLLSLDIKKYDLAMSKFILQGIDDGHTSIETTSLYGLPTFANSNYYFSTFMGERYDKTTSISSELRGKRKDAGLEEGLDIVNQTAFISFDKFNFERNKDKVVVLKKYQDYKDTNPKDYVESNTMEFFASCFNEIEKNGNVKNVVIDLTCNTGGKTATLAYLISYLTNDPTITVSRELSGDVIEFHYVTDLDQDGVYGSSKDTFQEKYNFYILISGGSFSCGNHFPTICKDCGIATIIGETSAGGSCVVSQLSNSSGYVYHSSSEYVSLTKEGSGYSHNDNGVTPDIGVDSSLWYDHSKLDAFIANIKK